MKSPLRKLRGLTNHRKSDPKDKKDPRHQHRHPAKHDELVHATQDMLDMRSCYDSLLSAAAATTNGAYEFSEALDEMGTCLLEKTALNEDEESGRVLLMLGKVQFELQKLVDNYRGHIIQTISTPSESLLKELQTVEEMKHICDEKKDRYKSILVEQREKGRSRNMKSESFSSQQLQEALEDYEVEANLFIFRLKSLKQGQSRTLLTQAARHHAAQLNFFRKGLKFLEAVEPHVKVVTDREHIDYQFSGLEDDDTEDEEEEEEEEEDDYYSYDGPDAGELSFDYGQNDQYQETQSSSTNSMELDQVDESLPQPSTTEPAKENVDRSRVASINLHKRHSTGSQSAPIFLNKKFEIPEKIEELQPSSTRKFHTYVLPTPLDAKRSVSTGRISPVSTARFGRNIGAPTQLWHSSPLEPYKFVRNSRDDELSSPPMFPILKESNINSSPIRMPPPLSEELLMPHLNRHTDFDMKKVKRQSFSGPLTGRHWSNKSNVSAADIIPSAEHPVVASMMPARVQTSHPSISPKVSPNVSPPPMKSPKISELHELPRPPIGSARPTRPTSLIGYSAPLLYRGQELNKPTRTSPIVSHTASPLPTPPAAVQRSYSIPSRRRPLSPVAKFLGNPHNVSLIEDVASPPLTPISLTNVRPASHASASVTHAKEKGFL